MVDSFYKYLNNTANLHLLNSRHLSKSTAWLAAIERAVSFLSWLYVPTNTPTSLHRKSALFPHFKCMFFVAFPGDAAITAEKPTNTYLNEDGFLTHH